MSITLDLVEIGRHVSGRLREQHGQSPVVWGLNLYGPPQFCRNPRYESDPSRPLREIIQTWPSATNNILRDNYESLWRAYSSLSEEWDHRSFANVVDRVLSSLCGSPAALVSFAKRIGAAAEERALLSTDEFRSAEVLAVLATSLLPYGELEGVVEEISDLLSGVGLAVNEAIKKLIEDLEADRFALLTAGNRHGLAALFILPHQVANILGWAGAATMLSLDGDLQQGLCAGFGRILDLLLEHYNGSIVAMSDAQAPAWALALAAAHRLGFSEQAEMLVGLIYHSLTECGGNVARSDIPHDKVLNYLLARQNNAFKDVAELIQRPDETTTVVLRSATLLGLEDVLNDSLWELDHHAFLAFVPDDYSLFASELMEGGRNDNWIIGHDVFKLFDLNESWSAIPKPASEQVAGGAMLASLLYPDRVAWFVFDNAS